MNPPWPSPWWVHFSHGYDRLDLVAYTDRQYRTWTYVHDANRRLTSVTDPQGQQTLYGYNKRGQVTTLTPRPTSRAGPTTCKAG